MNLTEEFKALIAALEGDGVPFAVCGGMAMGLHGFPRFTKDIDLLVLPQDVSRIVPLAKKCGFDDDGGTLALGAKGPYFVEIRRINKFRGEDHLILDLIVVTPVLEDVWAGRVPYEWLGQSLPVVSAAGLVKMKRLAGRPQDVVDIETLGFKPDDAAIQP